MAERATHIFVGPSIPAARVRAILRSADVHPPVKHGDALRLPLRRGDTIAIIDGLFLSAPAVRHKELLYVIGELGVSVFGAASMGALRAAELDTLGMRGVGAVYRLFRCGALERDDEVAVSHATSDEEYAALSEALVSTRFNARRARRVGVIDPDEEHLIVQAASDLPFPARRLGTILSSARSRGLSKTTAERYRQWVKNAPDIKRQDAERLLRLLANGGPLAPTGSEPVPRTVFLDRWLRETTGEIVAGQFVSDAAAAAFFRLFAEDYPALHYREILEALVSDGRKEDPSLDGTPTEELERMAVGAAARRSLVPAEPDSVPSALASWLDSRERSGPVVPEIARALVRSYRIHPTDGPADRLISLLQRSPSWAFGQRMVSAMGKATRHLRTPDDDDVRAWLSQRWPHRNVDLALADRGFRSVSDVRKESAPFLAMAMASGVPSFRVGPVEEATRRDSPVGDPHLRGVVGTFVGVSLE